MRIFINYRRDDTAGYAGRLYDRLSHRFGAHNIFMDIDTIMPGQDFVQAIDEAVSSCDVLVALIGKQWLTITDREGRRRLENPHDYTRLEIATALDRNVWVIPVLVRDAGMPRMADLPEDVGLLARRQALEISDGRFHQDVDALIESIETLAAQAPGPIPAGPPARVEEPPRQKVEVDPPPVIEEMLPEEEASAPLAKPRPGILKAVRAPSWWRAPAAVLFWPVLGWLAASVMLSNWRADSAVILGAVCGAVYGPLLSPLSWQGRRKALIGLAGWAGAGAAAFSFAVGLTYYDTIPFLLLGPVPLALVGLVWSLLQHRSQTRKRA